MWLLHTTTGGLRYFGKKPPKGYLILSHVWTADEQTFQDIKALEHAGGLSAASAKIRDCCAFARRRGFEWVWIDTCCIDKTSSAELSESINSMYVWYRESDECVAFLQDVDESEDPRAAGSQFRRSRWYTRGWTLQELIAPRRLLFVSRHWRIIGTKAGLADVVGEITNIEHEILTFRKLHTRVSVARRMSWAATRQTTREEDRAYSLLGIFNVNIPTVYGEGDHAFIRLQEEILKHIPDQSVFAWGSPVLRDIGALARRTTGFAGKERMRALLAVSPDLFVHSTDIVPISPESLSRRLGVKLPPPIFTLTPYGMHSRLPLVKARAGDKSVWFAVLACTDGTGRLVSLILQPQTEHTQDRYFVGAVIYVAKQLSTGGLHCDQYRLAALSITPPSRLAVAWGRSKVKVQEVLIPHRMDTFIFEYPRRSEESEAPIKNWERREKEVMAAPCEVVMPAFLVYKLERENELQLVVPGSEDNSLLFGDGQHEAQEIHLFHERSSQTIVIKVWPCANDVFQYLHSSVALVGRTAAGEDNKDELGEHDCTTEHVSHWQDYSKEFKISGRWVGNALYSLNIQVNNDVPENVKEPVRLQVPLSVPIRDRPVYDSTGEWEYWDGRVGGRPARYTDVVEPIRQEKPYLLGKLSLFSSSKEMKA